MVQAKGAAAVAATAAAGAAMDAEEDLSARMQRAHGSPGRLSLFDGNVDDSWAEQVRPVACWRGGVWELGRRGG